MNSQKILCEIGMMIAIGAVAENALLDGNRTSAEMLRTIGQAGIQGADCGLLAHHP